MYMQPIFRPGFSEYETLIAADILSGASESRPYLYNAAASPAHASSSAAASTTHAVLTHIKCERLSPHDSSTSRSRSGTPSTSSYPGTPPERGSPHTPPQLVPIHPPRNYSDIMRTLAARYNAHPSNKFVPTCHQHMNAFDWRTASTSTASIEDEPFGGIFSNWPSLQFLSLTDRIDMTAIKILQTIPQIGRGRRSEHTSIEHTPLDLSAAGESAAKRAKLSASPSEIRKCHCIEDRSRLSMWTVDEVCDFVKSIDICAEYATNFQEQRIDGAGLPLLTEDHLTGMLQMKLGPALKLRAVLERRLQPCSQCQTTTATFCCTNNTLSPKHNGITIKSENRSNPTSPS